MMFRMHLLAVVFVCLETIALGQGPSLADRPHIRVHGDAVVYVEPNQVVLTLGVEGLDPDIQIAKQKNKDRVTKVFAALKELGIASKDTQTEDLLVEPRFQNDYTKQQFIGYFVRNTIAVTLRDVTKVDAVVTRLLTAGVSQVHDVRFQTTELKQYREQTREMALLAAKEKATKMASVLEQRVGAPLSIEESSTENPWAYSSWGGGRNSQAVQNAVSVVPSNTSGDASESIALGKIAVRAGVTVTFLLIDGKPEPK